MTIESILPIPEIFSARRILCIQPHYDDNDIAAGGILTQLVKNGAELFYLTATNDLMGVIDASLSDEEAANALRQDQFAAAKIVGVKEQYWCGYPDAGEYNYFDLRRDFLKYIRMLKPDLVFAPDPWLAYEGHRDHIQTGHAAVEAVMFSGLKKIPSSSTEIDAGYEPHSILGVALYFTREPNYIADVTCTWEEKLAAVRCYKAQFDQDGMDQLAFALDIKSQQVAEGQAFARGEPLKVLHPSALHCGI
jgi:N,N'-diacetylchitobiose non-reducing end deacetylase